MHPLLTRQLHKAFPDGVPPLLAVGPLLELVDGAYRGHDADRTLIEHSLQVVSEELTERNRQLKQQVRTLEQMEVDLRHALKLEAVGQLASGIAHEINTPIQYIGDSVDYVHEAFGEVVDLLTWYRARMRDAREGAPLPPVEEVDEIESRTDVAYALEQIPQSIERTLEGVRRVAALVRAMKDFAHPDGREKLAADLNAALRSTLVVATNELKHVADVELALDDIPLIPCHVGEINQVFLNLLVNAAHAIADAGRGRGRITIRSQSFGDGVEISIGDTGDGIPAAIRERVFEPFFTTKAVGRGTGQGLAIARSIVVDKHGGTIHLESREGKGTTFFIRLPGAPLAAPPHEARSA